MKFILRLMIRGYQRHLSPFLAPACRFTPTCSCYADEALEKFGVFKGGVLALRRILRCHPFCAGGVDPVPATGQKRVLKKAEAR